MVAEPEETTGGRTMIRSRQVTRPDPADCGVAVAFRTDARYPHMTVEETREFGPKMNGHHRAETARQPPEASRIPKRHQYPGRGSVAPATKCKACRPAVRR